MEANNKPTVVVSRCLGFSKCRYNGSIVMDRFVQILNEHVNYVTVCPEADIGLGIPRDPVRLVSEKEKIELYQPATKNVYTKEMDDYSTNFFKSLGEVHGFILKGRSPSCGIKDVKIYLGKEKATGSIKGTGIFSSYAINKYPHLPIEEEGRLTNYAIREHFLTKLFTFFNFQQIKDSNSMKELVKFHSDNKYLFLSYNQSQLKNLGKIVANHEKKLFKDFIGDYEYHLGLLFAKLPRKGNYINACMHIFGHFSENLSKEEKDFFLDRFDKYKENKIHLSVVMNLLKVYAIKYKIDYILNQTIWLTYPEELHSISDSGK
jgi:uncharacterized protein YbgA (DUF1722 family)/uncharacterized protein YbbK (DUF523 family)